ncbi:nitric oxide reductase transcriptional regulator NorR [Paracandidimonas soli]|uniref:Anaerobic nitric oxide reductase transcription regulator n=1 Tax=Paracandidimonas soli TaxID=1917182 RepID=A0A4R3VAH7_9BURK|nr:nitric oxide reductase transcriptional regulator NorR [Paracandidimonas soli]TCV00773.1 anaerobic nitric oxide reductase transcription regulator [Paracandidimonas soli]
MRELLLTDLVADLPNAVRLQRAVHTIKEQFRCDAVGLLHLDGDSLRLVAATGLAHEALGRHFTVAHHPRFSTILSRREPTWFEPGSILPDPYDGLLEDQREHSLHVHDCLGASLYVEGRLWGVLTLDAQEIGAFDDNTIQELQHYIQILQASIRVTMLERENRNLRQLSSNAMQTSVNSSENEIIGGSDVLRQLLDELDVIATSDLPILLLGETGVGKELFARRIHKRSNRSHKPMVHVNCAALPESLAESELFGHVKGAFSGATTDRPGRFEAAQGGTLFLDEVGELPLNVQAKLLRALQNGEVQRLGTDHAIKTDVRIIAATNRDLKAYTQAGDFRADLYHRLSVYPVHIPPLRERGHDILMLAGHFLEFTRSRLGLRGIRLSSEAEQALMAYPWPGNVRELEHVISRAALKLLSSGLARDQIMTIHPEPLDLDLEFRQKQPAAQPTTARTMATNPKPGAPLPTLREAVEQTQAGLVRRALAATDGHWANAARLLGLDPSNLHKLAKKLGVKTK